MKILLVFSILVFTFQVNAASAPRAVKCYNDNKASCQDGSDKSQHLLPSASAASPTDPQCCAVPAAKTGCESGDLGCWVAAQRGASTGSTDTETGNTQSETVPPGQ